MAHFSKEGGRVAHFSYFPAFYPEMIGTKKLDDARRKAYKEDVKGL